MEIAESNFRVQQYAVASGVRESLPVEGKALERAVASWIKEPLLVKSRSLYLWKARHW